jgi:hypothetical protein
VVNLLVGESGQEMLKMTPHMYTEGKSGPGEDMYHKRGHTMQCSGLPSPIDGGVVMCLTECGDSLAL